MPFGLECLENNGFRGGCQAADSPRLGGKTGSAGASPDHLAANPIIRNQHQENHQKHGEIKAVDPFRQPVRHQDQARLEMDKNEVEKDQTQVDDLFLQVQQPSASLNLRRRALGIRPWSQEENGIGQSQEGQEKERLSDRINKEGPRPLPSCGFRAPDTGPECHFLRKPGISINRHHPRHDEEKPGSKG